MRSAINVKGTFVQKNKYCLLPPKVIAVVMVLTANLSKSLRFKKNKEIAQRTKMYPHLSGDKTKLPAVGIGWSTLCSL